MAIIASKELVAIRKEVAKKAPGPKRSIGSFKPLEGTKEVIIDLNGSNSNVVHNRDIFVWKPLDMLGILREVVEHALKIRPGSKPMKQRLHRFDVGKHRAIGEEIMKLLVAEFIKEVYHPKCPLGHFSPATTVLTVKDTRTQLQLGHDAAVPPPAPIAATAAAATASPGAASGIAATAAAAAPSPAAAPRGAPSRAECSVHLKLGVLGEFGAADGTKEPAAAAAPSVSSMKRPRSGPGGAAGAQCPSCAVDSCKADLSKCRDYHRRHKVCEAHSKTPVVVVPGREMRFCQQCSRAVPTKAW
ncbi:uncharacterized protein [Miscanthus floridulus]|uniref:uncharacterized protein n=1 Tax=Miscanthus floridulus TaxID=154761 RepID=UPI003459A52C